MTWNRVSLTKMQELAVRDAVSDPANVRMAWDSTRELNRYYGHACSVHEPPESDRELLPSIWMERDDASNIARIWLLEKTEEGYSPGYEWELADDRAVWPAGPLWSGELPLHACAQGEQTCVPADPATAGTRLFLGQFLPDEEGEQIVVIGLDGALSVFYYQFPEESAESRQPARFGRCRRDCVTI